MEKKSYDLIVIGAGAGRLYWRHSGGAVGP